MKARRQRKRYRRTFSTSPPTTSTTAPRTTSTAHGRPLQERLHPLPQAQQLPRHRDQRPDPRLELRLPIPALRRPDARRRLHPPRQRRRHGRVLALGTPSPPTRKPTGRVSSPTISSPTAPTREVSRTGNELKKVSPEIVGLQQHNQVAILYSRDSLNALDFMPFASGGAMDPTASPSPTTPPSSASSTTRSTTLTSAPTSSSRDTGLLPLQAPHRARPLHLGRRAAPAHFRLREEWRPRRHDLQEWFRQ